MERVTGLGGVFFRARDPRALGRWYAQHLGVTPVPDDYAAQPWQQTADPTLFAPFPQDSDYFGRLHDPEGNPIELWQPRDPAA